MENQGKWKLDISAPNLGVDTREDIQNPSEGRKKISEFAAKHGLTVYFVEDGMYYQKWEAKVASFQIACYF
jgi:hypothetical protein